MFRRIKKIYDSLQFYKQTNIPNTSKEYNGRALVLFMKQSEKRYGQRSRRHFRTRTGQCWSQVCGELFTMQKTVQSQNEIFSDVTKWGLLCFYLQK